MNKVVFLDRDGTINVDSDLGYLYKQEEWQFMPGAIEGLQLLQQAGFILTVITNQTAIANGKYTVQDMEKIHIFMKEELAKEGIEIAAIGFCPHKQGGGCDCVKPKTGMLKQIEPAVGEIDYASSWTIGDKVADLGFGKTAGTQVALIRSRYWKPEELQLQPDMVVDSLLDAARKISHTV